ncbi:MHYT domain-containing protein [Streptomyces sp. NPDC050560]|uniref:MHYT domain-containing protein n=1 Tax=Streptomyces sp. NPDC050560 TaxID=3365630 RepID=UPI003791325E
MEGTVGAVSTVNGFSYGIVTPVAAYVMACLGGALGLRCLSLSFDTSPQRRAFWLTLASAALGAGIWTTHFIAMMGFSIDRSGVDYQAHTMFAGLGVAIAMVGAGIFVIGFRRGGAALFTGGTVTGLGIASMHFLGMAGMQLDGHFEYDTLTVTASVLIAVVAAVGAFWAAQRGGFLWSLGASLAMGLAVTGMHYVAMAAVHVHLDGDGMTTGGASSAKMLAPMLIGPLGFLLLAAAVVLVDPLLVLGRGGRRERQGGPRRDELPGRLGHRGLASLPGPGHGPRRRTERREPSRTGPPGS